MVLASSICMRVSGAQNIHCIMFVGTSTISLKPSMKILYSENWLGGSEFRLRLRDNGGLSSDLILYWTLLIYILMV